jgi:hypothetical protein
MKFAFHQIFSALQNWRNSWRSPGVHSPELLFHRDRCPNCFLHRQSGEYHSIKRVAPIVSCTYSQSSHIITFYSTLSSGSFYSGRVSLNYSSRSLYSRGTSVHYSSCYSSSKGVAFNYSSRSFNSRGISLSSTTVVPYTFKGVPFNYCSCFLYSRRISLNYSSCSSYFTGVSLNTQLYLLLHGSFTQLLRLFLVLQRSLTQIL